MSKDHGQMMGYSDAIRWVEEHAPDSPEKGHVLARMRYERDKTIPVKPRFSKGVYGKKYDQWICGNCGRWGIDVGFNYCPECGFEIGWNTTRCLTGYKDG